MTPVEALEQIENALRLARELAGIVMGSIPIKEARPMVRVACELDEELDKIGVSSWVELQKALQKART